MLISIALVMAPEGLRKQIGTAHRPPAMAEI
jgi:hypothetical protein